MPTAWSQVATDVIAQKYFRKAGVPARLKRVKEKGVPEFLWRSVPDEAELAKLRDKLRPVTAKYGVTVGQDLVKELQADIEKAAGKKTGK